MDWMEPWLPQDYEDYTDTRLTLATHNIDPTSEDEQQSPIKEATRMEASLVLDPTLETMRTIRATAANETIRLTNGHSPSSSDTTAEDFETNGTTLSGDSEGHEPPSKERGYYPPLGYSAAQHQQFAETAWRVPGLGMRFAPLRVPGIRRLQTLAVLAHCTAIVFWPAFFFFICAMPLFWGLIIVYLIHMSVSVAATDGSLSWRWERLRRMRMWRLFADYYPAKLHKTFDLDPSRKYILGYHPHGIISHGAWAAFATDALGFSQKFPGITNSLLTLDNNFKMPFYRDWLLWMGLRSVSRESIWNTLTKGGSDGQAAGRAVTIVIGGARESLEAQPGTFRLILNGRKGFIKMAIRTGADLVPVMGFGENDLYDQLSPKSHPLVHKFQMLCLKIFKFTLPALHGRGVLNYDIGLMPYRRPLNIVVGRPIRVTQIAVPGQAEIDRIHKLYQEEVQMLWDAYKDEFAKDRNEELVFTD